MLELALVELQGGRLGQPLLELPLCAIQLGPARCEVSLRLPEAPLQFGLQAHHGVDVGLELSELGPSLLLQALPLAPELLLVRRPQVPEGLLPFALELLGELLASLRELCLHLVLQLLDLLRAVLVELRSFGVHPLAELPIQPLALGGLALAPVRSHGLVDIGIDACASTHLTAEICNLELALSELVVQTSHLCRVTVVALGQVL
mmetsp:Transcript_164448/g.527396  ORF Transcript_164448/g.527396 Transcript_164448/m.527396 type:complete len:205 (+) Transcript_164448:2191-2805(+)